MLGSTISPQQYVDLQECFLFLSLKIEYLPYFETQRDPRFFFLSFFFGSSSRLQLFYSHGHKRLLHLRVVIPTQTPLYYSSLPLFLHFRRFPCIYRRLCHSANVFLSTSSPLVIMEGICAKEPDFHRHVSVFTFLFTSLHSSYTDKTEIL